MISRILVAGGAGYIGSHICKALAESGVMPVCYDTLEKGHDWAVRWGPLERGDIGDAQLLVVAKVRHGPDVRQSQAPTAGLSAGNTANARSAATDRRAAARAGDCLTRLTGTNSPHAPRPSWGEGAPAPI